MEPIRLKLNFDDIRELIRKHNSSEYGKNDNPIVLFPSDINAIAHEILEMHKREVLPQANVIGSNPTTIEKNNLPEDVRYAFNEGVDLYQCIQHYEIGNLIKEVFIDDMRKIKARYK